MNKHPIRIGIFAFALGIWATIASADDRDNFKRAYTAYQQHISTNETQLALAAAKDAHKYGTKVFGKSHANSANLALNYARLLNDTGDHKRARKTLKGALKVLEKHYGDSAPELVPMVIEVARAAKDPATAQEYLTRAASLSRGYKDQLVEAQKNFDIVVILLNWGGAGLVEPFVDRAYEIYVDRLQPNDFRLGLMSYHKARWAMARDQHENAIGYLERALMAFKVPAGETIGDLELTVRQLLVQTHEKLKQSAAATEHLLVLGAHQDWSATAEPVFRTEAELPAEVIEKRTDGEVTLVFTIDEQGFVVQPTISESTDEAFSNAALAMVERFRYAPRFINGNPVATDGINYTAHFNLSAPAQQIAERRQFDRPPIKEMMIPDRNDKSQCFDGGLGQAAKACQDLPTFK